MDNQIIIFCVVAIGAALFFILGLGLIAPWVRTIIVGARAPINEIAITRLLCPINSDTVIDGYVLMRRSNIQIELKDVRDMYMRGPSFFMDTCSSIILDGTKIQADNTDTDNAKTDNTKIMLILAVNSILAIASISTAIYFYFILEAQPLIFIALGGAFFYAAIQSAVSLTKKGAKLKRESGLSRGAGR